VIVLDPYPRMLRVGAIVGVVLLAISVPAAALLRGAAGAWTAVGVNVVVVGMFLLTGLSLRWAGRRGPTTVQAVALGGLLLKLSVYGLLLVILAPLGVVDRPTLAVTAPVVIITLLVAEVRLVMTNPEFRMLHDTPDWARDGKDRV
jgi:hypothetical protein